MMLILRALNSLYLSSQLSYKSMITKQFIKKKEMYEKEESSRALPTMVGNGNPASR